MLNQIKYAIRENGRQRMIALGAAIALNVVFGFLALTGITGIGWKITAVVFSALTLCALFSVCIVWDIQSIRSLFSAPAGYNAFLTPVPRWKMILSRSLLIIVLDSVSLFVGICGVVFQSLLLSNIRFSFTYGHWKETAFAGGVALLGYALIIMAIFFGCALSHSIYFHRKGRGFLSFLSVCGVLYLLHWMNLILALFGSVSKWKLIFVINLNAGFNAGTLGYVFILLLQSVLLFVAATYLMERRVNI